MSAYSGPPESPPQSVGESENPPLDPHPLILKLLAHADHPQSTVVLTGYIGPAEKVGFIRFYLELDLGVYLEIPLTAVIHSEPVDGSQSMSKTKLVINATGKLKHVKVVEASFFKGNIASNFLDLQSACKPVELPTVKTPACPPPPPPNRQP